MNKKVKIKDLEIKIKKLKLKHLDFLIIKYKNKPPKTEIKHLQEDIERMLDKYYPEQSIIFLGVDGDQNVSSERLLPYLKRKHSWIFKKYSDIVSHNETPLKYRRVSDLLVELENSGMLVSRAYSRGRGGYGKEYKLKVDPSLVGPSVDEEFYDSLVRRKASHDRMEKLQRLTKSNPFGRKYGLFSRF